MSRSTFTPALCRAAGADAANRHMRAAGRSSWNEDDADVAATETLRLMLAAGHITRDQARTCGLELEP